MTTPGDPSGRAPLSASDAELLSLYGPEIAGRAVLGDAVPRADRPAVQSLSMDRVSDLLSIVDGDDPERRAKVEPWARRLSWALDELIEIPVINRRVGLDGILGLVPVVGEGAGLVAAFTVVVSAMAGGASIPTLLRMLLNIGFDALFGSVPIIGQAWDFFFKANTRNLRLLEADLADREATRRSSVTVLLMAVVAAIVLVAVSVLSMLVFVGGAVWLVRSLFAS